MTNPAQCHCGSISWERNIEESRFICASCKRPLWQPIEPAPKVPDDWQADQPSFLVWDGKDTYCVQADLYVKDNGCGCCSSEIKATHWMPIPEGPGA
jgi:hypothetical protein